MGVSVANDVATHLEANGHGSQTASPPTLYRDTIEGSHDAIGVLCYGGPEATRTMGGVVGFEYPNVQVQVRKANPVDAEAECYAIYQLLDGQLKYVTLNGTQYTFCRGTAFPQKLRIDDNGKTIYYCEFQIERRPA